MVHSATRREDDYRVTSVWLWGYAMRVVQKAGFGRVSVVELRARVPAKVARQSARGGTTKRLKRDSPERCEKTPALWFLDGSFHRRGAVDARVGVAPFYRLKHSLT